jgi:hypothetical protein
MSGLKTKSVVLALAALLSGCATAPLGPTVSVLPPQGKPFDVFAQDQAACKQYADGQVAGQAQAANNNAIGGAVLGTALGAGLGAALGGGRGAAVGAASGAVVGTGVGAGSTQNAQIGIQQQYDNAYAQCMVSKGNQVAGYAPPPGYPPPGYPPPPPAYAYPPPGY